MGLLRNSPPQKYTRKPHPVPCRATWREWPDTPIPTGHANRNTHRRQPRLAHDIGGCLHISVPHQNFGCSTTHHIR